MTLTPRVAESLRLDGGSHVNIIYGYATTDSFIGEDCQLRDLDAALWHELRAAGFARIVYGKANDPVYFLDAGSLDSLRPAEQADIAGQLAPGPLSGGNRRRPVQPPGEAEPGQLVSDVHAIKTITGLLRDSSVRTAAVLLAAEEYLAHVVSPGQVEKRLAEGAFTDLFTTAAEDNRNLLVLIFHSADRQDVLSSIRQVGALSRFAEHEEAREAAGRAIHHMDYPGEEELERLVRRLHLRPENPLSIASWSGLRPLVTEMAARGRLASRWVSALGDLAEARVALSGETLRAKGLIDERPPGKTAAEQLAGLVGLESVKQRVAELAERGKANAERRRRGLPPSTPTLHLVFTGNPGTGKTEVAKLMGEFYREAKLLSRGHLVRTTGADLIGPYIGSTTPKTLAKIDEALDGVLFVDEAYGVIEGSDAEFGGSAIDALVDRMDEDRDRLAVIFAGYSDEIQRLLAVNPGLLSRFPEANHIHFPDYGPDELFTILKSMVKAPRTIDPLFEPQLRQVVRGLSAGAGRGFGNGRTMRNLMESLEGKCEARTGADLDAPITSEDLDQSYRRYLPGDRW